MADILRYIMMNIIYAYPREEVAQAVAGGKLFVDLPHVDRLKANINIR